MDIKITMRSVFAIASFALLTNTANAVPVTYYDVDFSSPTHTVGSQPTTGAGIDTPSSVGFGNPVVGASLGALNDQPLIFNTTGNTTPCCFYDQIRFDLGAGSSRYVVSFDVSTDNYVNNGSGNNFALLFDTPQVRNVYFNPNGTVSTYNPSVGSSGSIGSFVDNTLLSMEIDIDLVANLWSVAMNDVSLFTGAFNSTGGDIDSFRFSFGGAESTNFDSVGLDNILVTNGETAAVPEPSAIALLGLGLLGLGFARRRKYS